MKRKITAAVLCLCLAASFLLGGCKFDLESEINGKASQTISTIAQELENKLNDFEIDSKASSNSSKANKSSKTSKNSAASSKAVQSSAEASKAAGSYTMADIKKLKNTQNLAKNTLEHIFDGTINGKGNATGYHYTRVTDSKGEVIKGSESAKDAHGVFTGKVKVNGVQKKGFSSFYPEDWTPQQVVDAVNEAYEYALNDESNPHGSLWIGYSGDLEIDMYLDNNKKITTAYPIYEGD